MIESDIIRLFILPILLWAAWSDIKTRRVPNKTWIPVIAIAVIAFAIDVWNIYSGNFVQPSRFIYITLLTLVITIPFSLFVYTVGGFGGADVKALILFGFVFPSTPSFIMYGSVFPIVTPEHGIFPLTIFGNALLIGLVVLPFFIILNSVKRNFSPVMFLGLPRNVQTLDKRYGKLLETQNGFTRSGIDLDVLNGYTKWRVENEKVGMEEEIAEEYLEQREYNHGATPNTLNDAYELINTRENVWVSPGTPFFVPILIGLIISLTYGDMAVSLLSIIGV